MVFCWFSWYIVKLNGQYAIHQTSPPKSLPTGLSQNQKANTPSILKYVLTTPKHADRGLNAATFPIYGHNIWLLWPPGDQSHGVCKKIYSGWSLPSCKTIDVELRPNIVEIIDMKIKNPMIVLTEGFMGLFIPPGWRHVVWTIEEGLLTDITFVVWLTKDPPTFLDTNTAPSVKVHMYHVMEDLYST